MKKLIGAVALVLFASVNALADNAVNISYLSGNYRLEVTAYQHSDKTLIQCFEGESLESSEVIWPESKHDAHGSCGDTVWFLTPEQVLFIYGPYGNEKVFLRESLF